jgi:hypothetical protein
MTITLQDDTPLEIDDLAEGSQDISEPVKPISHWQRAPIPITYRGFGAKDGLVGSDLEGREDSNAQDAAPVTHKIQPHFNSQH